MRTLRHSLPQHRPVRQLVAFDNRPIEVLGQDVALTIPAKLPPTTTAWSRSFRLTAPFAIWFALSGPRSRDRPGAPLR